MDKLTPFQEALLSSVSQEFSDVPAEEELADIVPDTMRKAKRPANSILRRSLIAAAAIVLLSVSVYAAVRFGLGNVAVDKKIYHFPETGSSNAGYLVTFNDSIAAEDAPDYIGTYHLPSRLVNEDNLDRDSYTCFFEGAGKVYYPLQGLTQDNQPLAFEETSLAHYQWVLHGTKAANGFQYESGYPVTFSQRTAKSIEPGKALVNYQMSESENIPVKKSTFVLGSYEVFSLTFDLSAYAEDEQQQSYPFYRVWYWTDGNYLYELSCGAGISDEEMLEIFESIAPVEDINAYIGIE